ncbi:MAG: lactate dehydrogenase [Clostridium sp.]|uniref:D-isomer specific 2-hydroxyacid dehydrogenase family protein n=1 Tax=Clostridium sp. TaxID=1506 RepID=UPI0025C4C857|nr:D-isomer specific 2-hydroxyacid dehydrogenase family protein [Clostridium sp.]MBS4958097.1 lactate dehydrogenase [Clostridium sp.]
MNKIVIFNPRPDEMLFFTKFEKEFELDIKYVNKELNKDTACEAQGFEAVSVQGSNIVDREALKALSEIGVKFLALRSIGYNNVDSEAAKEYGIRFSNVNYSTNSVADFTVMLMLMCSRKMRPLMIRNDAQDYSLVGNQGREMHNLTVGIIGTGKIGATVAQDLTGFGCKILGYDVYENDNLRDILEYVSFDEIIEKSDIITLHAPLFESNYHMINKETIAKMKHGVCIINCGRGPLIDTDALIEGIQSGKISAAGLDTIEEELDVFHADHRLDIIKNNKLAILRSFPNVIVTPHCSFYTDQAVSDMVENSLRSNMSFLTTGESRWEIKIK